LRALINLAHVIGRSGGGGDVRLLLEEARALAADTGNAWFEAVALANLGSGALVDSDLETAVTHLRPAVVLASSLSDRFILASAETNLAAALIAQGHREEAIELYRRACVTWMELGSPEGQIWCLEGFAFAAADDDPETAARIGGASLRACDEIRYVLPEQEQLWRKRRLERISTKLDPMRIQELELEGRRMSLPESLDYALTVVD
jgi:Flp pilus assembly protein TadD